MFNAPEIITMIPDIAQIYNVNDAQCDELESAIEELDNNLFLEEMNENMIARWESMLQITALDDDTVEDRRFRIKMKVLENLPYSYNEILRRLHNLCPEGCEFILNEKLIEAQVKLALTSKRMLEDVDKLLADILPLNIAYAVSVIWNQHKTLASFTHKQLSARTHKDIREEVF